MTIWSKFFDIFLAYYNIILTVPCSFTHVHPFMGKGMDGGRMEEWNGKERKKESEFIYFNTITHT